MLNPSTADHLGNNDPTIARCERRTRTWGFGRIEVVNLFAFRSPRPHALFAASEPVGPENDEAIRDAARAANAILCAWGSFAGIERRASEVMAMLGRVPLWCLGVNRSGDPTHPLYLPYSTRPIPYR